MLEIKDFRLRLDDASDEGEFTGYASVFGVTDAMAEVVDSGAFKKTLKESKGVVPILWQHRPAEPIGLSLELEEDAKGLALKGQLNLETQRGREAHSLLRQGALRGLSIGFQTVKDKVADGLRHLTELALWEVSLVTFPANSRALVADVRSHEIDDCPHCKALLARLAPHVAGATSGTTYVWPASGSLAATNAVWLQRFDHGAAPPPAQPVDPLRALIEDMKATVRRAA